MFYYNDEFYVYAEIELSLAMGMLDSKYLLRAPSNYTPYPNTSNYNYYKENVEKAVEKFEMAYAYIKGPFTRAQNHVLAKIQVDVNYKEWYYGYSTTVAEELAEIYNTGNEKWDFSKDDLQKEFNFSLMEVEKARYEERGILTYPNEFSQEDHDNYNLICDELNAKKQRRLDAAELTAAEVELSYLNETIKDLEEKKKNNKHVETRPGGAVIITYTVDPDVLDEQIKAGQEKIAQVSSIVQSKESAVYSYDLRFKSREEILEESKKIDGKIKKTSGVDKLKYEAQRDVLDEYKFLDVTNKYKGEYGIDGTERYDKNSSAYKGYQILCQKYGEHVVEKWGDIVYKDIDGGGSSVNWHAIERYLSPDHITTYYTLVEEEGEAKAQEYLSLIVPRIARIEGPLLAAIDEEDFKNYNKVGKFFSVANRSFQYGLSDGIYNFFDAGALLTGNEAFDHSTDRYVQAAYSQTVSNYGGTGLKIYHDVNKNLAEQVPRKIINIATGGNAAVVLATSVASQAGSLYGNAMYNGASKEDAAKFALITSPVLGVIDACTDASPALNIVGKSSPLISGMLKEVGGELIQDDIESRMSNEFLGEYNDVGFDRLFEKDSNGNIKISEEAKNTVIVTAISSLVGGVEGKVSNLSNNVMSGYNGSSNVDSFSFEHYDFENILSDQSTIIAHQVNNLTMPGSMLDTTVSKVTPDNTNFVDSAQPIDTTVSKVTPDNTNFVDNAQPIDTTVSKVTPDNTNSVDNAQPIDTIVLEYMENKYGSKYALQKSWASDFMTFFESQNCSQENINALLNKLLSETNLNNMLNNSSFHFMGENAANSKGGRKAFFEYLNSKRDTMTQEYIDNGIKYILNNTDENGNVIDTFIRYVVTTNKNDLSYKSGLSDLKNIGQEATIVCSLGNFDLGKMTVELMDGKQIYADFFETRPNLKNASIGSYIHQHIASEITKMYPDYSMTSYHVLRDNSGAIRFYERNGGLFFELDNPNNLFTAQDIDLNGDGPIGVIFTPEALQQTALEG